MTTVNASPDKRFRGRFGAAVQEKICDFDFLVRNSESQWRKILSIQGIINWSAQIKRTPGHVDRIFVFIKRARARIF